MTHLDPKSTQRALRRLHGESLEGGDEDVGNDDREGVAEQRTQQDERVERLWRRLEPPPTSEPPPGFAARTTEALRARQAGRAAGALSPAWASGTAAAALAAGLLLGLGVGQWTASPVRSLAGSPLAEDPSPTRSASQDTVWEDASGEDSAWNDWSDEDWTEEGWSEAWSRAYDSTFTSAAPRGDDS